MARKLFFMAVALSVWTGTGACIAGETPFSGRVNTDGINLRLDATTSAPVLAVLNKGERIEAVAQSYDWYKVRIPAKLAVYIRKGLAECIKYTDTRQMSPGPLAEQCLSAKVLKDRVNIRAKPDEGAPILGVADRNEIVNVVSETGGWYRIEPIQNSFGWVHKKFIDKADAGAAQEPAAQQPADNVTVFIGMVEPYGMVFMRPATHKLVTRENKTFLLKGNRATLNALNRQNVRVTGKLIDQPKAKYPVIEVKIIEVAN